ncbi:MAG: arginine--tRNA ligase [Syntrophobacterales bacterium]|nr:MAG: arginine--tRNA ligase [Syntrophobacterales bacterium]
MKKTLTELISDSIRRCMDKGLLGSREIPPLVLESPKEKSHGDYATNIAMVMAAREGKPSQEVARIILSRLEDEDGVIERTEIGGPGFINFYLKEKVWYSILEEIERRGEDFGKGKIGEGRRVQVEFISANPTGPLHVGHGRGAAIGDALAKILEACNYRVFREYYINDVGSQMNILGESILLRYLHGLGKVVEFPDYCYQGDYIVEIAKKAISERGDEYLHYSKEEAIRSLASFGASNILRGIQGDLDQFGVHFDGWFSEKELYQEKKVKRAIETLKKRGLAYEKDGALWLKTSPYGDEKDRVLVKDNGETTYFASDVAYHKDKFDRGFEVLINIWGADHHGYVPRMKASLMAMGKDEAVLKIVLVQLVSLMRDGKPIAMSTRAGEFTTLRNVVEEVGRDAARFFFLMRRPDSQLDFDLELAKRQSNENPVYYVQYAHARICSIIREALNKGIVLPKFGDIDCHLLNLPEELDLLKLLTAYPEVIEASALSLEPHRIPFYLMELSSIFHSYYNRYRVISSELELTKARLFFVGTIKEVIKSALNILGISAPEKM